MYRRYPSGVLDTGSRPAHAENVNEAEAERRRLIADVASRAAGLLAHARRERDRRLAARQDSAWFDQVQRELEPLSAHTHDLETFLAIATALDRHGPGPYPADELAAIAGITPGDTRRVLNQMVDEGLATPGNPPAQNSARPTDDQR